MRKSKTRKTKTLPRMPSMQWQTSQSLDLAEKRKQPKKTKAPGKLKRISKGHNIISVREQADAVCRDWSKLDVGIIWIFCCLNWKIKMSTNPVKSIWLIWSLTRIQCFAELFMDHDKMSDWNNFVNCSEDEQHQILDSVRKSTAAVGRRGRGRVQSESSANDGLNDFCSSGYGRRWWRRLTSLTMPFSGSATAIANFYGKNNSPKENSRSWKRNLLISSWNGQTPSMWHIYRMVFVDCCSTLLASILTWNLAASKKHLDFVRLKWRTRVPYSVHHWCHSSLTWTVQNLWIVRLSPCLHPSHPELTECVILFIAVSLNTVA